MDPRLRPVVEDDPSLRELYTELLHEDRWEARAASDGVEALSPLDSGLSPCVVLIDLRMPRIVDDDDPPPVGRLFHRWAD